MFANEIVLWEDATCHADSAPTTEEYRHAIGMDHIKVHTLCLKRSDGFCDLNSDIREI